MLSSCRSIRYMNKIPMEILLPLLIISHLLLGVTAQSTQCGFIGNSNEERGTERRDLLFYLDVDHPAPCNGTITNWRVCYYGPSSIGLVGLRSYWANYAVYRRVRDANGSQRYIRVSEIFSAARGSRLLTRIVENQSLVVPLDGEIRRGFTCYSDTNSIDRTRTRPLTVQAGDVVGACVFNPIDPNRGSRVQLDVVGESSNAAESLLGTSAGGCTVDTIPSTVLANQMAVINSRRLHIHARIGERAGQ